ncbi:hypothetical protein L195_g057791, partial [Trifolium pratense]
PTNSQQRNTVKHTTPVVNTSSSSATNSGAPLNTDHVPSPTPTHIESETAPIEEDNDHNSQPENFIPFGDPTLPGPHNPHLPWGKDHSHNKVWIYTLKG